MKGIRNLFLILSILFIGNLTSQTPGEKAVTYKERLYAHFLVIDTSKGACLPAARVWPEMNCDNAWHMQTLCGGKGMVPGKNGLAEWMDGTVHWAQYAAWLGTEFYLNNTQKKNQSHLRHEISMAWYVLERLDKSSKIKYGREPK